MRLMNNDTPNSAADRGAAPRGAASVLGVDRFHRIRP